MRLEGELRHDPPARAGRLDNLARKESWRERGQAFFHWQSATLRSVPSHDVGAATGKRDAAAA
jgi:hypothetical protein